MRCHGFHLCVPQAGCEAKDHCHAEMLRVLSRHGCRAPKHHERRGRCLVERGMFWLFRVVIFLSQRCLISLNTGFDAISKYVQEDSEKKAEKKSEKKSEKETAGKATEQKEAKSEKETAGKATEQKEAESEKETAGKATEQKEEEKTARGRGRGRVRGRGRGRARASQWRFPAQNQAEKAPAFP